MHKLPKTVTGNVLQFPATGVAWSQHVLQTEKILTFIEATKTLPPIEGRRVHPSTIWRWASRGTKGVRLEALRLGGRWVTSVEALERFGRALADKTRADLAFDDGDALPSPVAARAIHVHEIEAAERACDRAGITA